MNIVTISPRFQIGIPKRVRENLGLRSGAKMRVFSFRDRIEMIPQRDIRKLRGILKGIDTSSES
jgi:AbrB family looped-hinge helix DNA binding protein